MTEKKVCYTPWQSKHKIRRRTLAAPAAREEEMPLRFRRLMPCLLPSSVIVIAALLIPMGAAQAYSHQVLYNFCSAAKCTDGSHPNGRLAIDSNGNLYGATRFGGAKPTGKDKGYGTIFELVKSGSTYTYNVLWRFSGGNDGGGPNGGLVVEGERIFGTARFGGKYQQGVVFELHPITVVNRQIWKIDILHAFCRKGGVCSDGDTPLAGLAYYGMDTGAAYNDQLPLYGTASAGGIFSGFDNGGVVFSLSGTTHAFKVLARLGASDARSRTASMPAAELAVDAHGTLYGSTLYGKNDAGADGAKLFLLHAHSRSSVIFFDFCGDDPLRCWGTNPSVALDSNGSSIWFTAATTGYQTQCNSGKPFEGTLWGGDPSNPNGQNYFEFCGPVFGTPSGKAILNGTYGTTWDGGTTNEGVVYGRVFNTITTVHDFCLQPSCTDGAHPTGGVVAAVGDNLYGATTDGGANGAGTIYVTTEH